MIPCPFCLVGQLGYHEDEPVATCDRCGVERTVEQFEQDVAEDARERAAQKKADDELDYYYRIGRHR